MTSTLPTHILPHSPNEKNIPNGVFRHGEWLLHAGREDASEFGFRCNGTRRGGVRQSTPRFNNALSALAYAVTRIDYGDWK